jgi:S-formylglutathione hydrolase FrmB
LSGGLDLASRMNGPNNYQSHELTGIFGDVTQLAGSEDDLLYLLGQLQSYQGAKPKLFQCCGTEDFLYNDNQTFKNRALQLGIDLTYEEGTGVHDWNYWEPQIRRVLDWLPL